MSKFKAFWRKAQEKTAVPFEKLMKSIEKANQVAEFIGWFSLLWPKVWKLILLAGALIQCSNWVVLQGDVLKLLLPVLFPVTNRIRSILTWSIHSYARLRAPHWQASIGSDIANSLAWEQGSESTTGHYSPSNKGHREQPQQVHLTSNIDKVFLGYCLCRKTKKICVTKT